MIRGALPTQRVVLWRITELLASIAKRRDASGIRTCFDFDETAIVEDTWGSREGDRVSPTRDQRDTGPPR